jgi:hypothetical protein
VFPIFLDKLGIKVRVMFLIEAEVGGSRTFKDFGLIEVISPLRREGLWSQRRK